MSSSVKMFEKIKRSFRKLENNHHGENSQQEEILPYGMTYLTPAMTEEARTQLKETDEVRMKALEEFRKLIDGERNLATPTDDLFLLAFLRSRKFNVKKAFKLLQNYWAFRKEYRYIYDTTNSSSVVKLILRNFMGYLPYRDRNGSIVFIFKVALWDPQQDTFEDLFRAVSATLVYAAEFPATQITGYRAILDIRGLSWTHMKYFTPSNVLLLIRSTQFCFPARYKGIHLLSDNKMIKFISTIVFPLLTSKLRKRIMVHYDNNLEGILDYIDPSVLPVEFGGEAPEFENSKWEEIIENNSHRIIGLLNYGYIY